MINKAKVVNSHLNLGESFYHIATPAKFPDHILLNFSDDPATTVSVTWRTNREINKGFGEIAQAKANPKFVLNSERFLAKTSNLRYSNVVNHYLNSKKSFNSLNHNYHSVTFTDLEPNTTYAYRVGDGKHWSEWIQFTTAYKTNEPFSFLYVWVVLCLFFKCRLLFVTNIFILKIVFFYFINDFFLVFS